MRLLLLTAVAAGLLLFFAVTDIMAQEAVVLYINGDVMMQRAGEDRWVNLTADTKLKEDDKIKTLGDSRAEIALDPSLKNIVKLQEDTEITVKSLRNIYLSKGRVFTVIESLPAGSSFEVRTPTAVAGVAGSGMSVGTDGKSTDVGCFEDKVYVRGIMQDGTLTIEVYIDEGYKRVIDRFELPGDLMMLEAFEMRQWSEFRDELSEHIDNLQGAGDIIQGTIDKVQDNIDKVQQQIMERQDRMEERFELEEEGKRDEVTGAAGSSGSQVEEY